MRPSADLVVVGGGIVGLGVARAAAEAGLAATLVERARIGGVATRASGAIVRTHYENAADARLALDGLASFERFADDVGGDAGFRRTGFLAIPDPAEVASGAFGARVEMLRGVGVDTELVDARAVAELAPGFVTHDIAHAAFEPRSGYADPGRTVDALAASCRRSGVELRERVRATTVAIDGGRARGVDTDQGPIRAEAVVLACGAWACPLAAAAGFDVPIRPTAAVIALFDALHNEHPAVIDVPNGVYFRPDRAGALVGRRDWNDRPIAEPDDPPPEISDDFAADARARVARRFPPASDWRPRGGRSGPLDMTPDGRPLLGPSPVEGLWLSVGWSGTGFKTGISAGRALVHWLVNGEPARPEYADLRPSRRQRASAGVRTPH